MLTRMALKPILDRLHNPRHPAIDPLAQVS